MPRKIAFTLAEVLITLGIIGVVAALTIPTLVQNYNTKQWNTAANVFSRKLEEALKTMNSQSALTGYTSTEAFVEELSKHFKTNKICKNNELSDCFSDVVYWGSGDTTPEEVDMSKIKTAKHFGQNNWDSDIIGVQFANGTSALIAYNTAETGDVICTQDPYSNQITGNDCLAILYDTSANKNPNTSGKDLRANSNVKKLGSSCAIEIGGTCYGTAFIPTPISKDECLELKANGYGINNCFADNDYWAGAVKACGGSQNLPSVSDLASMAEGICNDFSTNYCSSWNSDKGAALGFDLTLDVNQFWASSEHITSAVEFQNASDSWYFYTNRYAGEGIASRTKSTYKAMCKIP